MTKEDFPGRYPYRDSGMMYWESTHTWVKDYLDVSLGWTTVHITVLVPLQDRYAPANNTSTVAANGTTSHNYHATEPHLCLPIP